MKRKTAFISSNGKNGKRHEKKLPPQSAWGHYNKRQSAKILRPSEPEVSFEKDPIIRVQNVTLAYDGHTVIKDLSFDIRRGDYLCIIGENGSGKSTLLSALLSLKRTSGGEILYNGLKKKEIGVLPQQNQIQSDFPALVEEVVLTGCLGRSSCGPFVTKKTRASAFAAMEKLGITSLAHRPYSELSGGQKQRVLLARAICSAEKLLILDEPVTGLDPKSTADIYSLVDHLNREQRMTVITVTHDIPAALKYATHILRLNRDSVFFGSVEDYKALGEADRYIVDKSESDESQAPFGDGGFRYIGGEG